MLDLWFHSSYNIHMDNKKTTRQIETASLGLALVFKRLLAIGILAGLAVCLIPLRLVLRASSALVKVSTHPG